MVICLHGRCLFVALFVTYHNNLRRRNSGHKTGYVTGEGWVDVWNA